MDPVTAERDDFYKKSEIRLSQDFHSYELLLLRRLQSDPVICIEWKEKLKQKILNGDYDLGEIPQSLWYLAVTLDRKKDRFLSFVKNQLENAHPDRPSTYSESLLTRYMNSNSLTELHLDSIFKYGDDNTLPPEIFKCPSVRWLSMKYNYLDRIAPDIGRMSNLEYLALTNNKLQNKSIPYSLTFCHRLHTLLLDNNLLDALPGFLLQMPSLQTVHRHGNHNYFKSTFMWYHTDVNERILMIHGTNDFMAREPERLQFWGAKAVIASKIDFFTDTSVAPVLKDYIADIYTLFNVCGHCKCNGAKLPNLPGYKVITFKNPYLGNTCVPFQHWACCLSCAMAIEKPSRHEQIAAARQLDRMYDKYVNECEQAYSTYPPCRRHPRRWMPCRHRGHQLVPPSSPNMAIQQLQEQPLAAEQAIGGSVMELSSSQQQSRVRSIRPVIPCISDSDSCNCIVS